MKHLSTIEDAELIVQTLQQGELIAYPTEAVFGLGCDPDNEGAVNKLLALKRRPVNKGLILVANTYSQLLLYVDDAKIPRHKRTEIFSSWPGPVTWLLPAAKKAWSVVCGLWSVVSGQWSVVSGQAWWCKSYDKMISDTIRADRFSDKVWRQTPKVLVLLDFTGSGP